MDFTEAHLQKIRDDISKAPATQNETYKHLRNLQQQIVDSVQDVRERLDYINERRERREQRLFEKEQRNEAFDFALKQRNRVKEVEKETEGGRQRHRCRIEEWRDEVVKQTNVVVEKKPEVGLRRSARKRCLENEAVDTPASKRQRVEGSSLQTPMTSDKKSVPWLSTRASMIDENVFADEPGRQYLEDLVGNIHCSDEESEHSDSYLTEEEELLAVELSMVAVMQAIVPQVIARTNPENW